MNTIRQCWMRTHWHIKLSCCSQWWRLPWQQSHAVSKRFQKITHHSNRVLCVKKKRLRRSKITNLKESPLYFKRERERERERERNEISGFVLAVCRKYCLTYQTSCRLFFFNFIFIKYYIWSAFVQGESLKQNLCVTIKNCCVCVFVNYNLV
jgi:hypothetical protein